MRHLLALAILVLTLAACGEPSRDADPAGGSTPAASPARGDY